MTADVVALSMPAVVTLDDLAAMNAAGTNGHRYETSPEGMLSVMPPPDSEHAKIATRLMLYAVAGIPHYWAVDQDTARSVMVHRLAGDSYVVQAKMPLAWLLQTPLKDHLGELPS